MSYESKQSLLALGVAPGRTMTAAKRKIEAASAARQRRLSAS